MKADYTISIGQLARWCEGTLLCGDEDTVVRTITSDSRETGDDCCYIAIVGDNFDGHAFIEPLLQRGAVKAFLTLRPEDEALARRYNVAAVQTSDNVRALGLLAAAHRGQFNLPLVGVTGTNGKTTTKEMIHAVMSTRWNTLKNIKNYNNEIGVPFTLLGLEAGHDAAVIEMGMNHSGELTRLAAMTRPTIGLITNVGEGHLEFLGSVENVAHAKAEMMSGMPQGSTILLNRETECLEVLLEHASRAGLVVKTFGLMPGADYAPESYTMDAGSSSFVLRGVECVLPLYGVHNLYNAVAAMAVAIELGLDADRAATALASFENVDKRSQRIEREFVLFNDTYNSNPLSLRKALESVSAVYPERRKIAVLADMKELGEASEYYHRQAGHEVYENSFTLLYTWGEMAGWMAAGARAAGMAASAVRHYDDKSALVADLKHECSAGDVLLVKGSRSMKMEEVAEELLR